MLGAQQPFVLRLPVDLHADLTKWAADRSRSLNGVVVEVIEQWWRQQREDGEDCGTTEKPPRSRRTPDR